MKKLQLIITFLMLIPISNAFAQSLVWNQCVLINAGSPSNFNYSRAFNSVAQSSTDVQVVVGFLACQPFATNTAGIRLNGTTFSETNVSAGNCSYTNTTFTISKSVFNEAVINGAGTITFSCFIRDSCSPGFGCSFTSDPCIAFTASYSACTAPVTPTFTQVSPVCSGASLAALPVDSNNGINGTWSPALDNTATTEYTFTPSPGQCATSATMNVTVNPIVAVPTGNENQTFCVGENVGNLIVDGVSVVWYDAPVLGNIVENTTLLTSGTTYYASQTIASCSSNTRLAVTVSDGECLSNESFDKLNLIVFPNPIKSTLNVSSENVISKISIYTIEGKKVISKAINATVGIIDTSGLPTGTYIVKVTSNDVVKTFQVIKE